jgi:pyridoxamine 5'-phosphate oxidase
MLPHNDPLESFAAWLKDATASEPDVPDAMQIATIDASGHPRVRTVLLKDHGPEGFVFYTNLGSAKGHELTTAPQLEAVMHWKSLARQVRFAGPVSKVEDEEADAYFASRPLGSQLGAYASRQSEPLADRATLHARLDEVTNRFAGETVPRPAFWGGYRIDVQRIEFWAGRADRLHDRIVFTQDGQGWTSTQLYP